MVVERMTKILFKLDMWGQRVSRNLHLKTLQGVKITCSTTRIAGAEGRKDRMIWSKSVEEFCD